MNQIVLKKDESPTGARQRLLNSAAELFNSKGYAATTVREIVKAAGVSKPVLYYYFRNKEGIFLELMRATYVKFNALVDTVQSEKGNAREKLGRFIDQSFCLFLEEIKTVRLMYSIYYGPHQGAPFFEFEIYHQKFQEAIRRVVEEGIRRKEFRDENPEDMTWVIIGAFSVVIEVELGHPEVSVGREGLARLLNLIFQGICIDDLVKSTQKDGFVKSSRCKARKN
ncbi:MAG: TetR/AcrR family transcriptional regulator [Deltaproteobacteria bacterium]|nr:TetR/AcrR family transcriptional regulator [Deltaproteobacteria bacterium]